MRITTISSYKGGVGKSLTAFNLSYNLASMGKKVLAVDTDPQGDLTYMCQKKISDHTLYDVFQGTAIAECIQKSRYRNLDILGSDSRAEEIACERADILLNELATLKERYDYVIIDCHPSMQTPTINALFAADDVIVPLKPNRFERNGLETMETYLAQIRQMNPKMKFLGILITMYAGRKSQKNTIEDILSQTIYPLMNTVISASEAANTSIEVRKPLCRHRKKDVVTLDYLEFTEEYIRSEFE